MFRIQVKIKVKPLEWEWRDLHPTNGKPYEYDTEAQAIKMLDMCYPLESSNGVRVIEL